MTVMRQICFRANVRLYSLETSLSYQIFLASPLSKLLWGKGRSLVIKSAMLQILFPVSFRRLRFYIIVLRLQFWFVRLVWICQSYCQDLYYIISFADSVHWYSYDFMKINAFGLSFFEFIIGSIIAEVIFGNLHLTLNSGDPDFALN